LSVPSELVAAYRAALYEVDAGADSVISFRVEERCAALEDVLRAHAAGSAVLITAYNPRSRKQTAEENTDAHRQLLAAVAKMGCDVLPSRGRDPDGKWPAEPGLLIFNLSREDALALARRFGQYAAVWIETRGVPKLLFAQPPSQKTP
jgi:hypothetical protein